MSAINIAHSLFPSEYFPCPCITQDLACQFCIDEALDDALDADKETDHQEWGTW